MRKFSGVLLAILTIIAFFTSIKSTVAELAQSSGRAYSLGYITGLQIISIILAFLAYILLRKKALIMIKKRTNIAQLLSLLSQI